MKKILVMLFVMALCIAMLTGCDSNTGDTDVIDSSNVVEENTESSVEDTSMNGETETADGEVIDSSESISEEESEVVEEPVMFSADEVMAHIDTLIAEYQYNDPEHIKALVIAANLDYISEEDLNTILTTYDYTMEELGVLYDECILDNGASRKLSTDYSQGNVDSLSIEDKFIHRINLESIMMDLTDKEFVKWYDELLISMSTGDDTPEQREIFVEQVKNCSVEMSYNERTMLCYTCGIFTNSLSYTDYLENPYTYYLNSNL